MFSYSSKNFETRENIKSKNYDDPFEVNDVFKGMFDLFDDYKSDFFLIKGKNYSSIKSSEKCTKLILDMPGINKEDIEVSLKHSDRVVAKGKTNDIEFEYVYRIDLSNFNLENTSLTFENGVLTVTLFKKEDGEKESLIFKL